MNNLFLKIAVVVLSCVLSLSAYGNHVCGNPDEVYQEQGLQQPRSTTHPDPNPVCSYADAIYETIRQYGGIALLRWRYFSNGNYFRVIMVDCHGDRISVKIPMNC